MDFIPFQDAGHESLGTTVHARVVVQCKGKVSAACPRECLRNVPWDLVCAQALAEANGHDLVQEQVGVRHVPHIPALPAAR